MTTSEYLRDLANRLCEIRRVYHPPIKDADIERLLKMAKAFEIEEKEEPGPSFLDAVDYPWLMD